MKGSHFPISHFRHVVIEKEYYKVFFFSASDTANHIFVLFLMKDNVSVPKFLSASKTIVMERMEHGKNKLLRKRTLDFLSQLYRIDISYILHKGST